MRRASSLRPLTGEGAGHGVARLGGRARPALVLRDGDPEVTMDLVATEEPLEIRVAGEPVAVVMRTPGEDHRLALGFLFAEGILSSAEDASALFHCGRPGEAGNVIDLAPASQARIDWARLDATRRAGVTTSSCGLCGRTTIADLLRSLPRLPPSPPVPVARVLAAVEGLKEHQATFDATGGTHAAALWARDGSLVAAHEDVGRHNAVDKVVGALLLARAAGHAPAPEVLAVSGRSAFEIVHKAARAAIPVVAGVSAPTSLAVELAAACGIALAGFVRRGRVNVYAGAQRIARGPIAAGDGG